MSARVVSETLHQGRCDRCGWHTWPLEREKEAEGLVKLHDKACPNPMPPRNGALMDCGCWNNASPGSCVGETREKCPVHGDALMVEANVPEPEGTRHGNIWTQP